MSTYQIKEQNYPYETVNAKTHLLAASAEFLSNQELIELAFNVSAVKATKLIGKIESINEVRWLIDELDEPNALQTQAMFELCRRFCLSTATKGNKVSSSVEIAERLMIEMASYSQENFLLITLDTKNQIIKQHTLFKGTLNQSVAHPRDIFRQAAIDNAARFIISHNHPSGDPTPSQNDDDFTSRLIQASNILGIPMLDHIVVGQDTYYSYAEETNIFT